MKCDEIEKLLILYIDDEISKEERDAVESHVSSCPHCKTLMDQYAKLKKTSSEISFTKPSDEAMDGYWAQISSRLSRGGGWTLLIIGSIILLLYAIYRFTVDPGVHSFVKVTIAAIMIGIVLLFISVLIERIKDLKTDRYQGIKK
jgi:predicted anti-sigma-YlaC factor YlaD